MNRYQLKTEIPEWMTKGKTTLIQINAQNGAVLNNYRPITCLLMLRKILKAQIRVEIYDSLINRELLPEEQKRCCKWTGETGENYYALINTSSIRGKRDGKYSYGVDWQQKGLRYSPPNLDNTPSQNVLVIKFIEKNHENLDSGIDGRRKKLNWGKSPERYIPRRCTITIIICNNHNATQSRTQEMHRQIQTL